MLCGKWMKISRLCPAYKILCQVFISLLLSLAFSQAGISPVNNFRTHRRPPDRPSSRLLRGAWAPHISPLFPSLPSSASACLNSRFPVSFSLTFWIWTDWHKTWPKMREMQETLDDDPVGTDLNHRMISLAENSIEGRESSSISKRYLCLANLIYC